MSGEVETFQKFHNSFKKLQRLKALATLTTKINADVFDVFSSYLSDLLTTVMNEYERCARYSSSIGRRLRLAAMQLALIYEQATSLMLVTSTPKPSLFESLEKCLRKFETLKLSDELFFVYFRALNYMWLLYVRCFANATATIKGYSMRVQQMYDSRKHITDQKCYDSVQLFAKTLDMQPMEHGREEIDKLFMKNLNLIEVIYRGTGDSENLAEILQQQTKIGNADAPSLVWVQKIVALAPLLLNESNLKTTAYYLIVALKMLRECSESEIQKSELFASVRLALATEWMNYAFAVLATSIDFLQKNFSNVELEPLNKFLPQLKFDDSINLKTITPGTSRTHFENIGDSHAMNSFDAANQFASISLSAQEISFCVQSIDSISTGQQLFSYAIDMIGDFVGSTDASAKPMDYIIYNYQLSDLLLIRSIFEVNSTPNYSFLKQRFERCNAMIQTLQEQCPKIFEIAKDWILSDLNEIVLDLYECNLSSLSNISSSDVKMIRENLMELRALSAINKN